MANADDQFRIVLENFNEGNAPLAHLDPETFIGNRGQASVMKADVISKPGFLTQSPALADLTNGTQAGVVDQLLRFILDKPTAADTTFAIGTTKLFKLSNTTVTSGGSPSWPQAITNMVEGESVIRLKANLYGFFNKASGGDIFKMPLSTSVIDHTWGSVTDQALEDALHPSAVNEDVMAFGNGRYMGVYIEGAAALDVQKLDFGEGAGVADVVFHSNVWWIAVNVGVGGRTQSHIYIYDGSALSNILSDEAGVGVQKIGFLYVLNGIVYVCYQDLTSDGFVIGFISGRQLKPLRYFSGTLPDHRQKTLYRNTILFPSSTDIWSCGAVVGQLPTQISKLADGGHATLGGIAAPFGTPMIASTDGGSNHQLAKFSGFAIDSEWKSLFVDIMNGKDLGLITSMIVITKPLGANARCDIRLEGNQATVVPVDEADVTKTHQVSGEDEVVHVFDSIFLPAVADVRAVVSYENGDATDDCPIRKIILSGNYVEQ